MAHKHDDGNKSQHKHDDEAERRLQQLYLEAQIIEQQLQVLQEHIQKIEQQMADIAYVLESLSDFRDLKPGQEILVPFSSGIFVKARLEDNQHFIVNVGSSVAVEKTAEETKKIILEQQEALAEAQLKYAEQYNKFIEKFESLERDLS